MKDSAMFTNFQNQDEARQAEEWGGADCAAAPGSAHDWKPIRSVKRRNDFAQWCVKEGPRYMRLVQSRRDNPFTFTRCVEVPAKLGKSGLSLQVPIPDQICNHDGSGPVSHEALTIWCSELWRLLRSEWEKTFAGMLHDMRRSLRDFTKSHPIYGKQLGEALQCDPIAEMFRCDDSAARDFPEAMAAYQRWISEQNDQAHR